MMQPEGAAGLLPTSAGATRRTFLGAVAAGRTFLTLGKLARCLADETDPAALIPLRDDGWPPAIIPAPDDPLLWPTWREGLAGFRAQARERLEYRGALYDRADFAWTQRCFNCGFVLLSDLRFIDGNRGAYRVEEFLDAEEKKSGGYDAIVLWHAYPRIGLDDRNQFDFYREQPGGLEGLRNAVRRLHARGVRAFVAYKPWDTGTRRETESDLDALAEIIGAIEADGVFLDTLHHAAEEYRARLDAVRPGVALESELVLPLEHVHDHHLSWMQWWSPLDSRAPGVLRNKWFERRHMQHQIRRWEWDHAAELHAAWMNGSGMLVWENVFGQWVGWSGRDQATLRDMLPIQRRFADLFAGEAWTPLVPTEHKDIFASRWGDGSVRLWTLVNRGAQAVEGTLLQVTSDGEERFYDLAGGREATAAAVGGWVALRGVLPAHGIGAFCTFGRSGPPGDFREFLAAQQARSAARTEEEAPQRATARRRPVKRTRLYGKAPEGMARIEGRRVSLSVEFQIRECGYYAASPEGRIQGLGTGKKTAFTREADLEDYAIDLTPVTNAQYAEFLRASGYRPRVRERFLAHWPGGAVPPGKEEHPVVYVDLDDARAYAAWAGKRLPTELEWQYAAQGPDALQYPWGTEDDAARRNGGESGGTTAVTAYPQGRSPFGLWDCCGNVWELTESEHGDGRNRYCLLKGGSYYRAEGSLWYFDGGPQNNRHVAKMLLAWPGLDRAATLGFRCAVDLESR